MARGSRRSFAVLGGLVAAAGLAAALPGCGSQKPSFIVRKVPASAQPVADSAAMVKASILPFVAQANLANSNDWAIPVVTATGKDPVRSITVRADGYGSRAPLTFPIPDGVQPSQGGDHHLAILDGSRELDLWTAARQADGSFDVGARIVLKGKPVGGPIAATASGFALTAGLIKPEEIAAGHIDHALAFTSPYIRQGFVAPATHSDGRQTDVAAMPMGTRIQLDPAADISTLPRPVRIIARALQQYGAYLVDTGGSLAFRAESGLDDGKDIWTPVGFSDASLSAIPWSRVRVLPAP